MQVTMISAGLLGLLLVALGARVVSIRLRDKVSLGDGGDAALLARIRAHGNCAEWAPIGLILLFLTEQAHGGAWFVVALAAMLVTGRVLHPFGLRTPEPNIARSLGMVLTWASIGIMALLLLVRAITL